MKKQFGLSLVELMISITLGLLLMAGVIQVFLSSKAVFMTQQGSSRIQETGRLAMEFIGRDLRMASYYGCVATINPSNNTSNITNGITGLTGLHKTFEQGLVGYTDSTLPNGVTLGGGTVTVKSPSDILVIRGSNERGIPIPKANPSTQTTAIGYTPETSVPSTGCVEGFCSGSIGVISNCQQGRFFKITGTPSISANKLTLTHTSWPATVPVTSPRSADIYAAGIILPVHTIVYFVGISSTPTGNTIPSLWQQIDNETQPVEILQGVDNISVRYSSGGAYQDAASVTNWDAISSVSVEVLVRGLEQNNSDKPPAYSFAGTTVNPTDKIIRQVFKATFSIRSRSN